MTPENEAPYRVTHSLPDHLSSWQLPPDWRWGTQGVFVDHRHFQEVVDALGRSLSLVSAPDPAHETWLFAEARHLAQLSHPSIPTTYHYWSLQRDTRRGPGYLRRWISGETAGARLRRRGRAEEVPFVLGVLRSTGSALVSLHEEGTVHGALSTDTVWTMPSGRLWLIGWQWALPREHIPPDVAPDRRWMGTPPEWGENSWEPNSASDQWQLAAISFAMLTGELPPSINVPPIRWVRPDCPESVAEILDRGLQHAPADRHASVATMLRALDRVASPRTSLFVSAGVSGPEGDADSEEARLRWAVGDDYEVLGRIGHGTFGSVWRARDLTLQREVALKMLHQHIARDHLAVGRFRREAQLAAQLAHPAIVPIYDWDSRGEVAWYTMELAEGGSVAELVARSGALMLNEVAPAVDQVLDGLEAAHANGIVHRDLKPENILLDRYHRWRIADFGIANVPGEDAAGASGTPAFAAPEQLLGEAQGPEVDCFAVAAIVAYTLSGHPPFAGEDWRAVLAQQLAGKMELGPVSASIEGWLRKGMAADLSERFPDAGAMRVAWRAAVEEAERGERSRSWWRWLRSERVQ